MAKSAVVVSSTKRRSNPAALPHKPRRVDHRPITRIFVVGEHAIYRDALRVLVESAGDFAVVGAAAHCVEAVKPVRECRPDILLLDLGLTTLPHSAVLRTLASACPPAHILVLVQSLGESETAEALRLGIRGVVRKDTTGEVLCQSLRTVASGQYWVAPVTLGNVVERLCAPSSQMASASRRPNRFGLTRRELDIVSLLVAGLANKEIADKCAIAQRTVKHHLTNLFEKLGVSNRVELAVVALHHRLGIHQSSGPGASPSA